MPELEHQPRLEDRLRMWAQRIIDGHEPHDGRAIACTLLDEVERLGLQRQYVYALDRELGEGGGYNHVFSFLRATPEQIARAFLAACGG